MREPWTCDAQQCRFAQTYAVDEYGAAVVQVPPAVMPALPYVFVFRSQQRGRFAHFKDHSVTAPRGTDVLDLIRLAWKPCLQAVIFSGGDRAGEGALTWVLEHDSAFRDFFPTSRMKIGTELARCRASRRRAPDAEPAEPCPAPRSVMRTVHPWGPIPPWWRIRHPRGQQERIKARYMIGEMAIDSRYAILPEPPLKRHKESMSYVAAILDGEDVVTVMVGVQPEEVEVIDADIAAFARSHDVHFIRPGRAGMLVAVFAPRR